MSIFIETFKPNIKAQLKKRQEIMTNRTAQNLTYLNARNAWIRMSSSVNIYKGTGDINNPGNYDNNLAKKYILQGGTLNNGNSLRSDIGDFSNAYSNKGQSGAPYRLGIRPMPGITGIEVKSLGAYGSLRQVTVKFQCWDVQQLEDLELLYMRPGYTVLVEWGWSPYFDESGNYVSTISPYDIINTTKSKETIWEELDKKMAENGNYEAMFGYVKNYNWKARMDGGYDCTTEIISLGEVVESLKVNYTPSIAVDTIKNTGYLTPTVEAPVAFTVDDLGKDKLEEYYNKNILAGMFYELYRIAYTQFKGTWNDTSDTGEYKLLKFNPSSGGPFSAYVFHKTIDLKGDGVQDNIGAGDEHVYISLQTLCNLLNNYVILRDKTTKKSYIELSVHEKEYTGDLNQTTGNGYLKALAHPLQVSVDPTVCLIRNPLWARDMKITGTAGVSSTTNSANPTGTTTTTGTPAVVFTHTFSSDAAVETFVKTLVKNLFTTTYNNDSSKDKVVQYIKDNIKGNPENVKAVSAAFVKLYNDDTYKIEAPDKLGEWGLSNKIDINNIVGKFTIKQYAEFSDTFVDLLDNVIAGNLSYEQQKDALGGADNVTLADTDDPIGDEIAALEQEIQNLEETVTTAKQSLQFLMKLPKPYFVNDNYNRELGIIGNIFVNVSMLFNLSINDELAAQDKKEKNDIALYDFVKSILSKISTAIGNVNNFDLFIEPNGNVARIIDINFTGDNPKKTYDEAALIEIHNLNSTVRSYSLESKIFPEQSTQVAIGAQVGGGALGVDTTTLVAYNRRILDRIIPIKDMPSSDVVKEDTNSKLEAIKKNIGVLYKYFADLKYEWYADSNFDVDNASEYANALKDLIIFFKTIVYSKTNNKAIIPTLLSIEMDGLGGLIIGNIFKIPEDILPKGYKGKEAGAKIGYVITGLGHSVENGDWKTRIESQFLVLDEERNPNLKYDFDYTNIIINLNTGGLLGLAGLNPVPAPLPGDYITVYGKIKVNKKYYPASSQQYKNMQLILKAFEASGTTNPTMQLAVLVTIGKECGWIPQSEHSYYKTKIRDIRAKFTTRVDKFTDPQLERVKKNDIEFFDHVYGRLSVTYKSWCQNTNLGDGFRYRGRGFNQLTFKGNYRYWGNVLGYGDQLVNNPELVNDPEVASKVAVAFLSEGLKDLNVDQASITDISTAVQFTTAANHGGTPTVDGYNSAINLVKYFKIE